MKMQMFATLAKLKLNTKYKTLRLGDGQEYDHSLV